MLQMLQQSYNLEAWKLEQMVKSMQNKPNLMITKIALSHAVTRD